MGFDFAGKVKKKGPNRDVRADEIIQLSVCVMRPLLHS